MKLFKGNLKKFTIFTLTILISLTIIRPYDEVHAVEENNISDQNAQEVVEVNNEFVEEVVSTEEPTIKVETPLLEETNDEVAQETIVDEEFIEEVIQEEVVTEEVVEETTPIVEEDKLLAEDEQTISTFNYAEEDRANKVYPEYLTIEFAQKNPGISGKFHLASQVNPNGPCDQDNSGNTYDNPSEHYIILKVTSDLTALAYVRCDVWQQINNKPSDKVESYLVEYRYENGDLISKEPVNNGSTPQNVPTNLGNGYWTVKGQAEGVEPSKIKITRPTTFTWHESKTHNISYTIVYKQDNEEKERTTINNPNVPLDTNTIPFEKIDDLDTKYPGYILDTNNNIPNVGDPIENGKEIVINYIKTQVEEPQQSEGQNVYVYVQITGFDNSSLQINKDGWYTVGKTQIAISKDINKVEEDYDLIVNRDVSIEKAIESINSDKFVHHKENQALTQELISKYMSNDNVKIKKESNGATGYDDVKGATWHMDININYKAVEEFMCSIIYQDGVENEEVFKNQGYSELVGNPTPKFDFDKNTDGYQNPERDGYIFVGWEPEVAEKVVKPAKGNEIVYKAKWEKDYSKELTYRVNYIVDGEEQPRYYEDKTANIWTNADSYEVTTVAQYVIDGYKVSKEKSDTLPKTVKDGGAVNVVYVVDESVNTFPYVIQYLEKGNETNVLGTIEDTGYINQVINIEQKTFDGYVQSKGNPTQLVVKEDGSAIAKVYYEKDVIGTDPSKPNDGDNIPDKYQVKVTYKVTNGSVDIKETYVTLYDKDGNYSENGVG